MDKRGMNLRQMEVFHAIMRCGSVTGAARQLNVSQPAVSATLRHCETQLGMKLFQRAGSRLQPTPGANAIDGEVAAIFSRVDMVGRMTRDMIEGQHGSIAVAGTFPVAHSYLAEATAAFLQLRPNINVSIQSLTHPVLIDRVVNREVELGITYAPVSDPALVSESLFKSEIACVMPTGHPLAAKSEVQATDLLDYPLITFAPQMIMRAIVDQVFAAAGVAPEIRVRVVLSFTAIILARAGAGVAIMDPLLLETLQLPGLVVRPLRPRAQVEMLLVHPRDAPLSQTMERFIACLREVLSRRAEPPNWMS
jgi:DNA-binding transcriptional LysR family regulator